MDAIQAAAALISLAALFSYINHRFFRLPMTIGLVIMSLVLSLLLIIGELVGLPVKTEAELLVRGVDFNKVLMQGMLGLLLFAGALHVNLNDLAEKWLEIGLLATLGVVTSTFLVGSVVYLINQFLELGLRYIDCLLFGALISPTDPIAVMGILKKAGAPKSLETKIAGESLFNDGIGVVVFLLLLETAAGEVGPTFSHGAALFAKEALGGAAFGLLAGYAAYRLLKSVNECSVEIMVTLALAAGGYSLAGALHLSAPIAMVLAGLLIGNRGRRLAMSERTRTHLDTFWELTDTILNALLFVLIGLEVLVLSLTEVYILAGVLAVPAALGARFISVGLPLTLLRRFRTLSPRAVRILTWAGLRGGISVALALSLPAACGREPILTMTYMVVIFSVVIQGLTVERVVGGQED